MEIYNWNIKIKKVGKDFQNYFTPSKEYEVRDGKIIIDKDYEHSNKKFSLFEFLKTWEGNWIITRIKVNGNWYKIEKEN